MAYEGLRRDACLVGLCMLLCLTGARLASAELPLGKSRQDIDLNDVRITFFSYKPKAYAGGPLIVTFHGSEPHAAFALNAMIPLANAELAIVIAPEFDKERFPRWAYQLGGIAARHERDGRVEFVERPPEHWTGGIVLELIRRIRDEEGRQDLPYYLVGHSGGAQFLSRFAAFVANEAQRIVLTNAGTYLFPDEDRAFPYGFGGLSPALRSDEQMRRYLASPITILLGTEDLQRWGLNQSRGAERQGLSRYERGVNVFNAANRRAADRGWMCNWRLIDVPEVGHSSKGMYSSPEARTALFGRPAPHSRQRESDGP